MTRYRPHFAIPEIGAEGQRKLAQARVLVVGVGGLGCPAATYLAAAGVGTLGLMDFDLVDESNLQRQVLYVTRDVGKPKADVARARLTELNPEVEVVSYQQRLTPLNALEIIRSYDYVLDGTDNFPTRYLINDACAALGKINVHGSVFQFEGQLSVFCAPDGPCYRCCFPEPPARIQNCGEGGVIGALPGVVGAMQAGELIKLVTGAGTPLIGRLLHLNLLNMSFRSLPLEKSRSCAFCNQKLGRLLPGDNYEEPGCGVSDSLRISPAELEQWLKSGKIFQLVDVRTAEERKLASIGGTLIEQEALATASLDRDVDVVVYCHLGQRSLHAAKLLKDLGFKNARSLDGGIERWAIEIDPKLPRY